MFTELTIVFTHDNPLTPAQARELGEMVTHIRLNVPFGVEIDDWDLTHNLTSDPLGS